MGNPGMPPPAAGPPPPGAGQPQQGPPSLAPGTPAPGSMGDLLGPSTNPDEHVMSGASLGPGLGPEAFGMGAANPGPALDAAKLAKWLPALEIMANRTGSSSATRQLVRTIKSQVSMIPGGQ